MIAHRSLTRLSKRVSGQEMLMTENPMPTNRAYQAEPIDPKQTSQQTPKDQELLLDWQVQQSQPNSSSRRTISGRMPLFGR